MYPSDVPHSEEKCTPNVPHFDFQKPHLKNNKWQPWTAVSAPLPSNAPPLSGLATDTESAGLRSLWWSSIEIPVK